MNNRVGLRLNNEPDLSVDAGVEEDQADVREELGQKGLGPEVVVDDVDVVGSQLGGLNHGKVVDDNRLWKRKRKSSTLLLSRAN